MTSGSRGALVAARSSSDGVYRRDFAFDPALVAVDPNITDSSFLLDDFQVEDSNNEDEAPAQDDVTGAGRETLFEVTFVQTLGRPGNLDYLQEQDKTVWEKTRDLAHKATISGIKEYAHNWRAKAREREEERITKALKAHREQMETLDEEQALLPATEMRVPGAASSQVRSDKEAAPSTSAKQPKQKKPKDHGLDPLERDARLYDSWIRGTNFHGHRQPVSVTWW